METKTFTTLLFLEQPFNLLVLLLVLLLPDWIRLWSVMQTAHFIIAFNILSVSNLK